jgi:hypothetical protein
MAKMRGLHQSIPATRPCAVGIGTGFDKSLYNVCVSRLRAQKQWRPTRLIFVPATSIHIRAGFD